MMLLDSAFWQGKRVLLTGHTGFKGSWAALLLRKLGAEVTGLALAPEGEPSLFIEARVADSVTHHTVDLRDSEAVDNVVALAKPDIVIHMAAQALVRRSYREPSATFASNVQGTSNLLDALRTSTSVKTILVVTSDKVYENNEGGTAFTEGSRLGGHDPYSASKAATEIVVQSYRASFFAPNDVAVATVRGGNVIGGGDFSEDRIVPDIWRAIAADRPVVLRNPSAVRPWQHVLDCLHGYLAYAQALHSKQDVPLALNIGPSSLEPVSVQALTETFFAAVDTTPAVELQTTEQPPEKTLLAIDPSLAFETLGWRDLFATQQAVEWTAEWYAGYAKHVPARSLVEDQIDRFMRKGNSE